LSDMERICANAGTVMVPDSAITTVMKNNSAFAFLNIPNAYTRVF